MGRMLIFDLMFEDEVCEHVEVNCETKEIQSTSYTDVPHRVVFGRRPKNIESLLLFFRRRVFPESRPDVPELLEVLGLREYSPLDICRKTHGCMISDRMWIRFEGEALTFKDVRPDLFEEIEETEEMAPNDRN